ncbi:uncharacterized protein LOC143478370 [Brachyhypopomus gauderio]|uniref:uncharacterized protein LOC143478370 n=1 Tax=Brachyhypopomus gauderio TaxID=698409 RepID=UPI004042E741
MFPGARRYACDIRVIRLLRERGLGNSPTRVLNQLRENHTEEWLSRVIRYSTECSDFMNRPGLHPMVFQEPPELAVVPSCKWLLAVYSQDILTRLDEINARITSTYGAILKLDSTKKITKKLAGTAKGTALWLTSVGNELGQVLISVLTAQEGAGLDMMADGLIRRYQQAGVEPPVVLYIDCGCCAETGEVKMKTRFSGWHALIIRLDIWHFMRRIAVGCTTDAHQLYPIFMARLSTCIFEWDAADVALLRRAKREQLKNQGLTDMTDADINKRLTKEELALHCRRRTRGEETTVHLIEQLLQELMGSRGNDSLGVPLLDRERMEHIWHVQKRHVRCIQDPPGVVLYTETGSITKGGILLKTYRCARGSTSLESFHLHLNRFIPGFSANSLNFQIYLLEGLHRWNQDRAAAALLTGPSPLRSYSGSLVHCANQSYEKVFGKKVVPQFCPPARYTGELIGVQYLFQQTGQALQDMNPDSEETSKLIEDLDMEEEREEDEGFCDIMEDPTVQNPVFPVFQSTKPGEPSIQTSVPLPLTSRTQLLPSASAPAPSASAPVPSSSAPAPSSSFQPSGSSSEAEEMADAMDEDDDMAVDDQNVSGFQHVDRLAEYLVDLRKQTSLYLTNQQAKRIISLWGSLHESDKMRVVYAARHQKRLLSGHFRTPKKPTHTPGVESTTRCVLGASSAPAQWPDCCRLVETVIIRLCNIYPCPKRKGRGGFSRWSLILQDYRKIRQLVLGNSMVMQNTEIQLVEINQNTLVQWHNARQRKQELSVLVQGTTLPPSLAEASEPLQQARTLQSHPQETRDPHEYRLPESTAGQAKQRFQQIRPQQTLGTAQAVTGATCLMPNIILLPASLASSTFQFVQATPITQALPVIPAASIQGTMPLQAPVVPGTMPLQAAMLQGTMPLQAAVVQGTTPQSATNLGAKPKRPYRRTVQANTCKKCGQFRNSTTGHSQFMGRVFCPQTESVSKEQWLELMKRTLYE